VVEQLLLVLKIVFVVLLYLFIWRVIRVATRDLRAGQESMVLAPVQPAQRRARPNGRLVVSRSPQLREGLVLEISRELVAGRQDGLDIALPGDGYASGRHARFLRGEDADAVEDLASTNGTFVNGNRLEGVQALRPGDVVTIGQTQLTYER
jgi:pSer/pThr/pTyr-binding forkhead associated (FHA) protein